MKPASRTLMRDQLDRQLSAIRRVGITARRRGWVRTVRDALGMNGRQLAERMGIGRSHLSKIEEAETRGATSLRTLERAADAMGCELVYAFVPKHGKTLEELVRERALRVAEDFVAPVAHSMALEAQPVDDHFRKREINRIAVELLHTMPRTLWNE